MSELMRYSKLVGAVPNCAVSAYHGTYAVRLETAPTGGESVLLFLESTIIDFGTQHLNLGNEDF